MGRIYPYFRFDGFTNRSEQRAWKVVELENEYILVMILPEIGGKIRTPHQNADDTPITKWRPGSGRKKAALAASV